MTIPAAGDFPFRIDDAIRALERTPGALRGLLMGAGQDWAFGNQGNAEIQPIRNGEGAHVDRRRDDQGHGETCEQEVFGKRTIDHDVHH